MNAPLLVAQNIAKSFYTPSKIDVLKNVSLKLYPKESLAIMGASGEGKSTLLQILGTLENPSEGNIFIENIPTNKRNNAHLRRDHLGFIFQGFHLLEDYNILENILMPAKIARKNVSKNSPAYKRCLDLLEKVGLQHRIHFSAKLLSGGEKQRVAIVRALCNNPSIILADEPTGNLDHQTSLDIMKLLLTIVKEENKGLIIVTHDKELADLCDKTLYLRDGCLNEISTIS